MAPTAMLPHAPPAYCAVVMAPVHVATGVALMPRSDRKYGSAGVSMAMPVVRDRIFSPPPRIEPS